MDSLSFFDREKRGIHDKTAGTQVLQVKKPWGMKKQVGCAGILLFGVIIIIIIGIVVIASSTKLPNYNLSPHPTSPSQ